MGMAVLAGKAALSRQTSMDIIAKKKGKCKKEAAVLTC